MTGNYRYAQLASEIERRLDSGIYGVGERLPGVRRLALEFGVSISTVQEALHRLEERGRLIARERSGFHVAAARRPVPPEPPISAPPAEPAPVTSQSLTLALVKAANDPEVVQFGAAVPHASFLPRQALARALAAASRREAEGAVDYAFPPGHPRLRQQLARRLTALGTPLHPDEIVVTDGCQEAVNLALRAVTRPGDVVVVESPTYYGLLQALESGGLQALEIPTHPRDGISLEALAFALERWPVRACIVTTNFSNPLGCVLSDARKQALVELLQSRGVPLIEDDIAGDLHFSGTRPGTAKSFDRRGEVLYCASVSKTLAPGLRVGWIAPGRYRERIEYLKFVTNLAAPTLNQVAVADLLASGAYDRHLREVRAAYARSVTAMLGVLERHCPPGTCVTHPGGGFQLWIQFPEWVDTLELHRLAGAERISVAPGHLFSASGKYRHCIRLNAALPWTDGLEMALRRLGRLAGLTRAPEGGADQLC